VNAVNTESGYTPLHLALFMGELRMAMMILASHKECDLNLRDRK
jgi:ankyrin repeat protein